MDWLNILLANLNIIYLAVGNIDIIIRRVPNDTDGNVELKNLEVCTYVAERRKKKLCVLNCPKVFFYIRYMALRTMTLK